jgi:hypothetical protein
MTQNTSHAVMQQRHEAHDSLDDFPTPPWAVRALIEHVLLPIDSVRRGIDSVWEPACNRGYMARPLAEYFGRVITSDIHHYGWDGQQHVTDFLIRNSEEVVGDEGGWIITNPPFRLAAQFVKRALSIRSHCAVLVRTAFLEGQDRYRDLFSVHPPYIVAQFTERVPMVKGRHDPDASTATSYCWVVWIKRPAPEPTTFVWIPPCRRQLQKPTDA